jgi:1-acyl-sn-glycerol-3-phosphate acyltransferase
MSMLDLIRPRAAAPATVDRGFLEHRVVPLFEKLIEIGYFSFEVTGTEHVPKDRKLVFAPNHSGWFPLDGFVLGLAVRNALGPAASPFFAAHDAATAAPLLGKFLGRVGALPASWFRRPERLPQDIRTVGIFPEGVEGNCKPFWEAYRMRPWKRGFVRVAVALDAPIVPVAILGGEECLPVAWTVRKLEPLIGSILGLPLSLVPLPSRWKVAFHPPVEVAGLAGRGKAALMDADYSAKVAREVQATVQETLDREAAARPLAQVSSLVALARGEPQGTSRPNSASPRSAARSSSALAWAASLGFSASARRSASSAEERFPAASRITARS